MDIVDQFGVPCQAVDGFRQIHLFAVVNRLVAVKAFRNRQFAGVVSDQLCQPGQRLFAVARKQVLSAAVREGVARLLHGRVHKPGPAGGVRSRHRAAGRVDGVDGLARCRPSEMPADEGLRGKGKSGGDGLLFATGQRAQAEGACFRGGTRLSVRAREMP